MHHAVFSNSNQQMVIVYQPTHEKSSIKLVFGHFMLVAGINPRYKVYVSKKLVKVDAMLRFEFKVTVRVMNVLQR